MTTTEGAAGTSVVASRGAAVLAEVQRAVVGKRDALKLILFALLGGRS